jgi:putative NADH-flavin reductase
MKRILVIGATGGTGKEIIAQALAREIAVTAIVRSADKLGALRDQVTVLVANALESRAWQDALFGHDAVISALGSSGLGPTTTCEEGARSTTQAMRHAGVERLLVVSAGMLFPDSGFVGAILRSTILRNVARDSAAMEAVVRSTTLRWTIVRPPRLTTGTCTKRYLSESDRLPPNGRGWVHRSDLAHFLISALETDAYVNQIAGVAAVK